MQGGAAQEDSENHRTTAQANLSGMAGWSKLLLQLQVPYHAAT
jgi:hypothetical protein